MDSEGNIVNRKPLLLCANRLSDMPYPTKNENSPQVHSRPMNKKIIFLDFDGVLNTEHYQNLLYYQGKTGSDKYGTLFNPEAVEQLKRIIDATHAEIVIESSWKCLGLNFLREMWEARIMPGWIIGITPAAAGDSWLLSVDLNETDPATAPCKGLEIASWLSDHATRSTRYVIIDDEFVILEAQRKHFLMTDSYNGITEELANRAIAILNG